jgi:hypothetical protein
VSIFCKKVLPLILIVNLQIYCIDLPWDHSWHLFTCFPQHFMIFSIFRKIQDGRQTLREKWFPHNSNSPLPQAGNLASLIPCCIHVPCNTCLVLWT